MKQPYHRKRYRDTCIGAGHIHCSKCDKPIHLSLWEYQELGEHFDICSECVQKELESHKS